MGRIILIGGPPAAGKSFLARKLSEKLKLPWISTDTVREQMKTLVRRADYPKLFIFSEATSKKAVEYYKKYTLKQIIELQNAESREVWKGIEALIKTDYVWKSFIVEGVAILPDLVSRAKENDREIQAVFVADENLDRIRKTIHERGLWAAPDKYPDSVKEKEIQLIKEFNNWTIRECSKFDYPLIKVGDRSSLLRRTLNLIK